MQQLVNTLRNAEKFLYDQGVAEGAVACDAASDIVEWIVRNGEPEAWVKRAQQAHEKADRRLSLLHAARPFLGMAIPGSLAARIDQELKP